MIAKQHIALTHKMQEIDFFEYMGKNRPHGAGGYGNVEYSWRACQDTTMIPFVIFTFTFSQEYTEKYFSHDDYEMMPKHYDCHGFWASSELVNSVEWKVYSEFVSLWPKAMTLELFNDVNGCRTMHIEVVIPQLYSIGGTQLVNNLADKFCAEANDNILLWAIERDLSQ